MKLNIFSNSSDNKEIGGGAAIAASLFLFLFLLIGLNLNSTFVGVFDENVYQIIISQRNDFLTSYMRIVSFIGSWRFIVGFNLILLIFVWRKKVRRELWFGIVVATSISALTNELLKAIFNRARPDHLQLAESTGLGFPSGHSMNGTVFFGILALIIIVEMRSNWKYFYAALLAFLILSIGVSRIYLGVHYPSDVVGGFLFGACILSIMIWGSKWKRNIF